MIGVFVERPWLALLPAAVFLALYLASRRRSVAATAAFWLGYGAYEYAMHRRWLCTGECDIRVDLLLLYPILAVMSVVAAVVAIRVIARRRSPS
jgi:hypothetical protein